MVLAGLEPDFAKRLHSVVRVFAPVAHAECYYLCMRLRLVTFALPLLVSAALVAAAIPASAGLSDAEQRFCDATTEAGSNTSPLGADPGALADYYRELIKVAPKKSIKKALKAMAKYYDAYVGIAPEDLAESEDFLTSSTYKKYAKATAKYSEYLLATCLPQA